MRNTLICTVGTSLLNNLKFAKDEAIQAAFQDCNWNQISLLLLDQDNSARICGAEINSITSICNKGYLQDPIRLIFLVSDTEDGRIIGHLLQLYYNNNKNSIRFQENVDVRVLTGLRDDNISSFKKQGLKSLVREISTEVSKFSPECTAINATGGYKAQISFAATIGQALEIPVYYLFEKFSEVIELPPQPISLDLAFWLNNYLLFESLESEQTVQKDTFSLEVESNLFDSLIDEETIDGVAYISLSAMGLLFNARSRLQFAKQETAILELIPQDGTAPNQKKIDLRDDHGKDKLKAFSKKLCQSPYVKEIVNSLPFNPHLTSPIRRTYSDGKIEFVLNWTDPGYGVCVQSTGRNQAETNSIALHLAQRFAQ
jgi:putative CRISPR-associated protein (TIGR02619 family)